MKNFLSIFGLFVCVLAMTACGGKTDGQSAQDSVPKYELQIIKPVDTKVTYSFPALLKGINDVDIYPQAEGRITGIFYEDGALVRKGQKLFTIESTQHQMQVNTDEASVKAAMATVNSAKLKLDSQKKLFEKKIVSEYVYRTAQNEYSTALAQLAQTKAQLEASKKNLSYCTVTSPINGIINGRKFKVGTLVSPTMVEPLTTVSDQSTIVAQFSIPENIFADVIEEQNLINTPNGYRSRTGKSLDDFIIFSLVMTDGTQYGQKGHFRAMSGMVDNQTGTATCYVDFKNPNGILRSGNSANITIPVETKGVFVVPQSACKKLQDKYILYKVNPEGKAESVIVEVFPTDDGLSYILGETDKLKTGDEILKTGVARVTDGMKLK